MIELAIKIPNAEHPISIERNAGRVRVLAGGKVIADTRRALTLREADHPSVLYIPRHDVVMEALQRSNTASYCPYKGEADHYRIRDAGSDSAVAWAYSAPYWAVSELEDHIAFNPSGAARIEVH